jgi:hypothetical protein
MPSPPGEGGGRQGKAVPKPLLSVSLKLRLCFRLGGGRLGKGGTPSASYGLKELPSPLLI